MGKMADEKLDSITIPRFLLEIFLQRFPDEVNDYKVIPESKRYDELFKRACLLKSQGYSQNEILTNLWVRSLERCRPPITEDMLLELVQRALVEDIHGLLAVREKIELGQWTFLPDERRIYFAGRLVFKLNEHQWWALDLLIERHRQGLPNISGTDIVTELNERLHRLKTKEGSFAHEMIKIPDYKKSRSLRDWAFRMGNTGDRTYGTLIRTTKGRGADIFLNLEWVPTDKDFLSR